MYKILGGQSACGHTTRDMYEVDRLASFVRGLSNTTGRYFSRSIVTECTWESPLFINPTLRYLQVVMPVEHSRSGPQNANAGSEKGFQGTQIEIELSCLGPLPSWR